ncbi:hypothetical protein GLYMA_07G159050v4 [Glycine max]|nr:hypothetical protein GLYMA_07G159050v4 [Glycine max]KAH1087075.1 hypothetical protein GYH30_018556 [Glycine max]
MFRNLNLIFYFYSLLWNVCFHLESSGEPLKETPLLL